MSDATISEGCPPAAAVWRAYRLGRAMYRAYLIGHAVERAIWKRRRRAVSS